MKRTIPEGVFDDGLTLAGFLFLQTLFIQRGRHETTWTVLRKFGYGDDVQLSSEYLRPPLNIPVGSTVELTQQGYRFLTGLFEKFDDETTCLSPSTLQSLFSVCSQTPSDFSQERIVTSVRTNEKGWITHQGFLSMWT